MNKFEEYKSFEEKSEHFSGDQDMLCGNIEYLFTTLEELNTSGNHLFRGVNNAKFKLYNSAQREFINREISAITTIKSNEKTYSLWIKELISEIKHWNKESVSRFFESIGINQEDDIAYLSLMQHLGYPTGFKG